MARFTGRVAALASLAALLLQAVCTIGFPSVAHLETAAPANSGCHETAPATPGTPNPGHACCSGDRSPDVLLSAANATAIPVVSQMLQIPAFGVATPSRLFASIISHPYSPPGLLVLRI